MEILITETAVSAGGRNEADPPRQWKVSTRGQAYPGYQRQDREVKDVSTFNRSGDSLKFNADTIPLQASLFSLV